MILRPLFQWRPVGGEQQECRGILEKKEEKQWIT